MDFRKQFIERDLKFIKSQKEHLQTWEIVFVASMEEKVEANKVLSTREFNQLQVIADRLRKRRS